MADNGIGLAVQAFSHSITHKHLGLSGTPDRTSTPVGEEGADEVLGVFRDVAVIRERQSVFMVHDLAVGSHQRVGVKRRVP